MPPITVAVADCKKSGRAACIRVLRAQRGIQVVAEARNGLEAMAAVAKLRPRILLLHLNSLRGAKINFIRALHQHNNRIKVILLTRRVPQEWILEALSHGVRGYLKENRINTLLPKAVRKVEAGEAWVPRRTVCKIIDRLTSDERQLTDNH